MALSIWCSRLNESPSPKEGKLIIFLLVDDFILASMKALPKREGNVPVNFRMEPRSTTPQ